VVGGEEAAPVAPDDLGLAEPGTRVMHVAEPERERLRAQALELGGPSTLLQYPDAGDAGIEITNAHPGSVPQFITGRPTLLSNLFRDEVALRTARIAADRLAAKDVELRTARGLDTVRLGVGLATWDMEGVPYRAPVLLRPTAIRRHHADIELKLHGSFTANPELLRMLATWFGIELDGDALAALAYDGRVFKPQAVIDHVRALTAHLAIAVVPRLVVSTFADVGASMMRDLRELDHPVLNALAGHPDDRAHLALHRPAPRVVSADASPPASDTLLLDADAEQEAVLARITDGQSLAVQTLPGTGGTQTVINAVGELVSAGKRVLVVSARRSTLDGVRHRLGGIGLGGLAVSPTRLRRDLILAIGRNEKAAQPKVADIDDALVQLRTVLHDYRGALTVPRRGLGVSMLDIVRRLTELAASGTSLTTQTRFDVRTLERLADARPEAGGKLAAAARLGEFRFGPDDSPWYGVSFDTTAAARAAHGLAGKLHRQEVPSLLEHGYALIAQTRMRPFATIAELGGYLRLLQGIRDSLDKFGATVFERPLAELIAAHGPRRDAPNLSGAERRRLHRVAREYVRPGVHVPDMYEALTRIQHQRAEWQSFADSGVAPEVPVGLADVQVAWQRADAELAELDAILGRVEPMASLPVQDLVRTLAGLATESAYFDNLVERATLRTDLAGMGLEPLLIELSVRHVPEAEVRDELEFAWWQSALEHLLSTDKALLGANTSVVDRLERDFRLVDEAHAAASGPLLAARLATQWRIGIVDHADEADRLRRALKSGATTPGALTSVAPQLMRTLAPVWMASPYDVPQIPHDVMFDVVLLADAAALSLAEAAPALRRARQVVVFGDPVTQKPTPFRVSVARLPGASAQDDEAPAFDDRSVFECLAEVLPVETLTRSYRAGGEDLAALVNDAFYGGELVSLPWAGSYLGRGSLSVDYVSGGVGVPDPVTGAVESPDAEVARVVTLVVEHAVNRGSESLMVITASPRHAARVRAAVDAAFAGRSDVADFVSRDTAEPFAVLTLDESVAESRDRVIFSLGFGLTRHGRVLSDFGDLSLPDGERLLTVAMTRARRAMVLVSSIRPSAFDDGRLEYGAASLMSILGSIAARAREARLEDLADPLVLALAHELRRLGVSVDVNYRDLLPLVAQYNGKAVVAESDPETQGESLRESLRLRPQTLRRLGWHYVRVHSFDLYSDPAGVASRIAGILGVLPETPTADPDTQPLDLTE
jgi:hypothetical protein